ncbi:MAG: hypothetical protein PUC00_05985 [Clostridiales bacterium]|nr:hypothetical protein [Clostridiales bacterium]
MSDLRRSLLKGMSSIVGDLYDTASDENRTVPLKPAEVQDAAPKPSLPPFRKLWKTADETIDWTDILVSPTPTDGLTPPDKWAMYHRYAAGVLQGDLGAYLAVLQADNPMADLTPYVSALDVTTVNADLLRATFTPRPDLLEKDPREYLCGMALRTARDLMAALPILEVDVCAMQGDKPLLTVSFTRQAMNKVRFAFIDPVAFAEKCGAVFQGDE